MVVVGFCFCFDNYESKACVCSRNHVPSRYIKTLSPCNAGIICNIPHGMKIACVETLYSLTTYYIERKMLKQSYWHQAGFISIASPWQLTMFEVVATYWSPRATLLQEHFDLGSCMLRNNMFHMVCNNMVVKSILGYGFSHLGNSVEVLNAGWKSSC